MNSPSLADTLKNAMEGAQIRADKSKGWERTKALKRVEAYKKELATLNVKKN